MKKVFYILFTITLLSCGNNKNNFIGTWIHESKESEIFNDTLIIQKTDKENYLLNLKISYKSNSKFSETKVKKEKFSGKFNDENNSLLLNNGKELILKEDGNLIIGSTEFYKFN